MNPESKFRSTLVRQLREKTTALVQPIESGGTARGIPDLYVAWNSVCFWAELKADPGVWPCSRKITFRPLQRYWLSENERNGGISIVSVFYGNAVVTARIGNLDANTDHFQMTRPMLIQPKINGKEWLEWIANGE